MQVRGFACTGVIGQDPVGISGWNWSICLWRVEVELELDESSSNVPRLSLTLAVHPGKLFSRLIKLEFECMRHTHTHTYTMPTSTVTHRNLESISCIGAE